MEIKHIPLTYDKGKYFTNESVLSLDNKVCNCLIQIKYHISLPL